MNIRRIVLTVICILSVSMIVSGCDSGRNHIESEIEGLNNEENKPVELRDMTLLNTRIIEPCESMFEAKLDNGKYVRMSFRSYDNADINIGIQVNGTTSRVVKLSASDQEEVVTYTINKTSTFKFVYELTNANSTVLDVIVKQYEVLP